MTILRALGISSASAQPGGDEPLFRNVDREDIEMGKAHALAAATTKDFEENVRKQKDVTYMAKLRFRDPDLSEETGEDQFLYMWLTNVVFHESEDMFSGVFFEVPAEMQKWHQVGQRLGFEHEDIFDWMINDDGKVKGAFTIRVTRSRLESEQEKLKFDEYIGIKEYENID